LVGLNQQNLIINIYKYKHILLFLDKKKLKVSQRKRRENSVYRCSLSHRSTTAPPPFHHRRSTSVRPPLISLPATQSFKLIFAQNKFVFAQVEVAFS